jgi:hypothetical protein
MAFQESVAGSGVPTGRVSGWAFDPALKRRAIIGCPCGTNFKSTGGQGRSRYTGAKAQKVRRIIRGAEAPLFHGCANQQVPRLRCRCAPAPVGMTGVVADKVKIKVKGDGQECPSHTFHLKPYNFALRRRRALVITETELKLMAAAAKMGLSRSPKNG